MAAITAGEILLKYSVKSGAAGNSTAGTATGSLGKYISTTAWAGGALNDLFDDVSGAENAASTVDYRCIFVHNSNTANTLENTVVYLSAETAGGASIAIATDNIAASAIGSASAQAAEIATETTAPTGVSAFSSPTTVGAGLSLGNIPSGQTRAFWIRRTAANTAALSNDGATIAVTGDTGSL
ncbi:hypothetical protein [uncultured Arthrobacter sp.]|uniref:hypothetical protein n=1 Tax=uncultured Arthrobacter sp. TaxID=114050 RepID=UPI0025E23E9E|nr:hypothetical protein [uncultured Arthrobacter sp.]